MLEVINGRMTKDEEMTHFTLWAMAKSSLIMTSLTNQSIAIVGNGDVIAIHQVSSHSEGVRLWKQGNNV